MIEKLKRFFIIMGFCAAALHVLGLAVLLMYGLLYLLRYLAY